MLGYDMNIIERGIRGLFAREFITRQRKAKYPRYCTVIDSDKQTEKFNTLSTLPQLQEMTDERVLSGFSEYSYEITNKVYATGIKVPRTLFEFDQTGQLRTLVQSLGARVANFPDKLMMSILGTNGTCYDNVAMFASTHDLGNGVSQDNTLTGHLTNTLVASTDKAGRDNAIAAFQMDLVQAKAKLLSFKDDRSEPWHEDAEPEALLILCHPAAEFFVRTAIEAALISDTGNITVRSVGGLITTNYDTPFYDTDGSTVLKGTWYLFKVDTPIQPMIFQRFNPKSTFPDVIPEADQSVMQALNSVEIQSIMRTGANIDAHTFFDDEFLFGARGIYSGGYGIWQNAVKVLGSSS